ncbi:helix-turn-helix domain-containing protein [Salinicoccus sp. Marseille-QA3877]
MIKLSLLGGSVLTTIGDRIRRERKRQGYSQEGLCEGICSQSTLSRLESNKLKLSFLTVNQILGRLDLSVNDLLAQEESIQENIYFSRLDEMRDARDYKMMGNLIAGYSHVTEDPSVKVKMYIKWHQGLVAFSNKDYETSSALLKHAIYIAEKFKYRDSIPHLYMALGNTMYEDGEEPLNFYAHAEELCHELEVPNFKLQMKILYNMIVTYSREGQYYHVILKCKKAINTLCSNESSYLMCEIYYLWLKALGELGKFEEHADLKASSRIIFEQHNSLHLLDKLENYSFVNS